MVQCVKCGVSIPEAYDEDSCPNCARKKADRVVLFPKPKKPVADTE